MRLINPAFASIMPILGTKSVNVTSKGQGKVELIGRADVPEGGGGSGREIGVQFLGPATRLNRAMYIQLCSAKYGAVSAQATCCGSAFEKRSRRSQGGRRLFLPHAAIPHMDSHLRLGFLASVSCECPNKAQFGEMGLCFTPSLPGALEESARSNTCLR
jgi:hypothetical protein